MGYESRSNVDISSLKTGSARIAAKLGFRVLPTAFGG